MSNTAKPGDIEGLDVKIYIMIRKCENKKEYDQLISRHPKEEIKITKDGIFEHHRSFWIYAYITSINVE